MRPMCASDSLYLRKNKNNFKILANCIKVQSRKRVLRLSLPIQDISKAGGGAPGTQVDYGWCTGGKDPLVSCHQMWLKFSKSTQQLLSALETPYSPHPSKKALQEGHKKNNNKIKLQFSKPEFILNNKMWKELRKQEAATVNDSQRMQSKPRHRQLKSFANAQTHSKLH